MHLNNDVKSAPPPKPPPPEPNIVPEGDGQNQWGRDHDGDRLRFLIWSKTNYPCTNSSKQVSMCACWIYSSKHDSMHAFWMSRNKLKYRLKTKHKIEQGSLILNAIQMDGFPEMVEVLNSLLGKFITFIENDCGYSGSVYYLMFNFFNHSFLRISLLIERKIIKNWWQAINGTFTNEYWKASCK